MCLSLNDSRTHAEKTNIQKQDFWCPNLFIVIYAFQSPAICGLFIFAATSRTAFMPSLEASCFAHNFGQL